MWTFRAKIQHDESAAQALEAAAARLSRDDDALVEMLQHAQRAPEGSPLRASADRLWRAHGFVSVAEFLAEFEKPKPRRH